MGRIFYPASHEFITSRLEDYQRPRARAIQAQTTTTHPSASPAQAEKTKESEVLVQEGENILVTLQPQSKPAENLLADKPELKNIIIPEEVDPTPLPEIRPLQLAYGFANKDLGADPADLSEIDTVDKLTSSTQLQSNPQMKVHFLFKRFPTEAVYLKSEQLPEALGQQAEQLAEGEDKRFILTGSDGERQHLAFSLKKAQAPQTGITLAVYDPLCTAQCRIFTASSPEALKRLRLEQLLNESQRERFASKEFSDIALVSPTTCKDRKQCKITCLLEPCKGLVHLSMRYGHFGHPDVPCRLSSLKDEEQRSGRDRTGDTALYRAMLNGHTEAVEAYVDEVIKLRTTPEERQRLVLGTPVSSPDQGMADPLAISLRNNHIDTALTFLRKILSSSKFGDGKGFHHRLLLGMYKSEHASYILSTFFIVLAFSTRQALASFMGILLDFNARYTLTQQERENLLEGWQTNAEDGGKAYTALSGAMQEEKTENVELYCRSILTSPNLSLEFKKRALMGRSYLGLSALGMTIKNVIRLKNKTDTPTTERLSVSHINTIEIFLKVILGSGLDKKDKLTLLTAASRTGVPALVECYRRDLPVAVAMLKIILKVISEADLLDEEKLSLMAAWDSDGRAGIYNAIYWGNEELIKTFVNCIAEMNLSDDIKDCLLRGRSENQKTTAIGTAIKKQERENTTAEDKENIRKGLRVLRQTIANHPTLSDTVKTSIENKFLEFKGRLQEPEPEPVQGWRNWLFKS